MTPDEIRDARNKLGFTQEKMAIALGLTNVMTYAKWEQGSNKPRASAISSIKMLVYMHSVGVIDGWIAHCNST